MKTIKTDVAVIGGGPAGMAAALAASHADADVFIIERNNSLGGILTQCIHDGFGLFRFNEQLTGPEYAHRFSSEINKVSTIKCALGAMVTQITDKKQIFFVSRNGVFICEAKSIVLATGCRERTRGAIAIPGTRASGIYTAGTAQQLINICNISVGKRAVILGSGDIGLIMARRLTLEGTEVVCVLEKLPYCNGLPRNVNQCLNDFEIPLFLNRTVSNIHGKNRVEGVTVSLVDNNGNILAGSEYDVECDTLILSVGLIPENELAKTIGVELSQSTRGGIVNNRLETSVPGIFMCGNALHVNDLVDNVSDEGNLAGQWAASFALGTYFKARHLPIRCGEGIGYTVPQHICDNNSFTLSLRASVPGNDKILCVSAGNEMIYKNEYKRVSPSEMIRANIPSFCENASEIEVTLI
jgi:NADPH-dependent 2,4-dienoyl-CoA reductase/sulfur reductase-like enzyme